MKIKGLCSVTASLYVVDQCAFVLQVDEFDRWGNQEFFLKNVRYQPWYVQSNVHDLRILDFSF